MNTLIAIGWLGNRRVYFNISREEAIRRYATAEMIPDLGEAEKYVTENKLINEVTFEDEFSAYDVWAP